MSSNFLWSYTDFAECANNLICSLNTIESYMEKFAKARKSVKTFH